MKKTQNSYKKIAAKTSELPDLPGSEDTESMSEANTSELTSQALLALRWFYERLTLTKEDRKLLFSKRGLTDATIETLGFRSNPESNKALLLEMPNHFPPEILLESGLWKTDLDKVGEAAKPNPQFYGMSIAEKRDETGRKVRAPDGEAIRECVWNNPILIPYFNDAGQLVHLRPHKGMMAGKTPRFYVPRAKGRAWNMNSNGHPKFAIITEGEFKAAALWQVLGEVAEIGALPGITMAKPLFGDIEEWLESIGASQVIVAYDNENKGDENLPGFQREKHRRFDTHVWARYLARQVSKQGLEGKVCVLPDSWRDEKGKADWDGALSAILKRQNMTDGETPEWDKVRPSVISEFLAVIHAAIPIQSRYIKYFDEETEQIIRRQLEKISYEPCLPIGGDEEQVMSRRLHRLASLLKQKEWFPLRSVNFLSGLAKRYQATAGRYYKMRPMTEQNQEEWKELQKQARERGDDDAKRACDIVLRGRKCLKEPERGHIPVTISDFYLRAHYVLHRTDGSRTRVVTIYNVHGANAPFMGMPSEDFGSPVKFRDWLHKNITGAAWDGGQSELTALHEDIAHALAFKDVTEVPLRGYHAKSKMWFFEDVAFSDEHEFLPDPKTGIFWIKNAGGVIGYTFARDKDGRPRDRENDVFRQGVPQMRPQIKDTAKDVRALFAEVVSKLRESLGGMEAYLALGMIFAAAAGPEIYKEWSCFPGLWVHGEQAEGKSSLVRWLIRIWGFDKEKGLPLPADEQRTTLTMAALCGALGQYGELQLWLDEFQPGTASWVRAILKNSYDRAEGAKKDFGSSPREFLASVIVSGVATSSEPQTRSRFAHIQVSSKKRQADHYEWFQKNSHEFYRLGRFLLRHRKAFAESALSAMRNWIESKAVKGIDDRARMVHAVAYAGFHAACEIFNVSVDEVTAYRTWLVEHCIRSASEIQESITVDLFWHEVLNHVESGAFGNSPAECRRYFQVIEDEGAQSPVGEYQIKAGAEHSFKAWKSLLLYFRPGSILEMLRAAKRRGGGDFPISQRDLLNQMKTRPYWHPSTNPSGHRQKFGGTSTQSCWCIKVDLHPLGFIKVSDAEFDESFKKTPSSTDWVDPRKGDLFALINSLQSKTKEEGH